MGETENTPSSSLIKNVKCLFQKAASKYTFLPEAAGASLRQWKGVLCRWRFESVLPVSALLFSNAVAGEQLLETGPFRVSPSLWLQRISCLKGSKRSHSATTEPTPQSPSPPCFCGYLFNDMQAQVHTTVCYFKLNPETCFQSRLGSAVFTNGLKYISIFLCEIIH